MQPYRTGRATRAGNWLPTV